MRFFLKYFYWALFILYFVTISIYVKEDLNGKDIPFYKWFLSFFLLVFFLFNAVKYGEDED
jgi:hypothetical protein